MRRNALYLTLFCMFFSSIVRGQDDFATFRNGMLSDYNDFRRNLLENYANFLAQAWKDYQHFTGRTADISPKPIVQPKKDDTAPLPPSEQKPQIDIIKEPKGDIPLSVKPWHPDVTKGHVVVYWYGMQIQMPNVPIYSSLQNTHPESIANYWKYLYNNKIAEETLPQIINVAKACQFNDWCVYTFVREYARTLLSAHYDSNTHILLCHYLLLRIGYDVRLTLNENNLFLLIPFYQQVYARGYLMIDNTPYYIYGEGTENPNAGYSSYNVPQKNGRAFNLILSHSLNIPYQPRSFHHKFGNIEIEGQVNNNLINVMAEYPQMPIPCYALSQGDGSARKSVLEQFKKIIAGMSVWQSANQLLHFVQSFEYATDDEQFGFEKPFFFEETLFYPKCDCEDRAIFYHYLIKELLKTDIHLVHYPGHECTAIHLGNDINGDAYMYKERKFLIADPTYIGADIGMCMPNYKEAQPEVELIEE